MVSNGDTAEDRGESIRIAAVQFPFIPIVIHDSENNWLSEPDGKINYWLNGKEIAEDFPVLSSVFLPQFSKEMTEHIRTFLSEDYQDWLYITIKDILYSLVKVRDVDIILFPEYSLPLEINSDLKSLIMSYSDGRCIVGGVGSICKNSSERKNRFFICNNNDIVYGEKVQPNNMEIDAGIKEGEGPLIHEIQLRRISQETIFTSVLMCSDSIEKAKDGSRVQDQLIKELNEKELDRNKINLSLIPALSTKTTDMENIGKICAPRFHEIVVLANCSFFGESCIWYPPTPGAKSISTNKVDRGDSACLIADIPLKFLGAPTSTTVGKPTSPQATPKYEIHKIVFRDESQGIKVDSENFFALIAKRLDIAITLSGIAFARCSLNDEIKNIINSSNKWKELQKEISDVAHKDDLSHTSIRSSDIVAFYEMAGTENLYMLMLYMLEQYITDGSTKAKVQDIMSYVQKMSWLPGPNLWPSYSRSNR